MTDLHEICQRAKSAWLEIAATGGPHTHVRTIYYGLPELMRMIEQGGPQTSDESRQLDTLLPQIALALTLIGARWERPGFYDDDEIGSPAQFLDDFEQIEAAASSNGRYAGDRAHAHRMELLGMLRQRVRFGGTAH